LSAFLSEKRKLCLLNGLSVFQNKQKASEVLKVAFSSWHSSTKVSCFTAKSVHRVFRIVHDRISILVGQGIFRAWSIHVRTLATRRNAAIQQSITKNRRCLLDAFAVWIRVNTTGFGVKRMLSERLRKLFFRWHTFVEYRHSKSFLKSKLQHQQVS
jgi:hypothetical protein